MKKRIDPRIRVFTVQKKHIMHIKCCKKKTHSKKEGYSTELKSLNHLSKSRKDEQITRDNDFTNTKR